MAFLPNQQDQNNPQGQQQNQIPQVPLIPSLQGTAGPTASQSTGTGVTNTATPAARPSAPWQNVASYLQANAGQANSVADVLAGGLSSQYNAANQGIQNTQQNFGQQIESARVPYNQQTAAAAKASPSQFASDPNNVAAFQKMYNAAYGGPLDFSSSSDYSNLASQVQKAQSQAALVNQGTPGLMTLLQQAEAAQGRNPTQGITALDSLLLQEDPSNFGKLAAAQAPFANLTGYLGNAQTSLDTAAHNAAQEAAATQNQLQNEYIGQGGIIPTFQQGLNTKLQGAQTQAKDYNQMIADITSNLGGNTRLDPTQEFKLDPTGGYSAAYNALMYSGQFPGVNPGLLAQYYNAPNQIASPTMANVASQQDLADAAALSQLTGQNLGLPTQGGSPFNVPTNIGSFNAKGALGSIFDTLHSDLDYLPYMTDSQLQVFPAIYNYVQGLSQGTIPFVAPTEPQPMPDIHLMPENPPPPSSGGGRIFY